MEPPIFSDLNRNCDRIPTPPTAGEYPIIYNTISPRLVGEMCAGEPEIRFDIQARRPVAIGVKVEMKDFYDPELSAKAPISFAKLERRADRGDRLAAIIRGLMGIRMAQCQSLPASMAFKAVRDDKPIMTASLVFLDEGIKILTREDETDRRLAEAQVKAREKLQAQASRTKNWEGQAAFGAGIIITGLAIMMMNRCNGRGSFGNTALPDCE
ncbi:hypothetical protein U0C82_16755 [Fulvimarina sp. 2208YS6-2-32]|uniref:Uncharacterized protein n=2 Tax=Fulvimarina uroteuthidis TaxID=3098149 RepID=A0ABU5I784_9HYPH|nr:hypothetical protein [Fulvimarina sp. 2208YS6-2-32]